MGSSRFKSPSITDTVLPLLEAPPVRLQLLGDSPCVFAPWFDHSASLRSLY